MEFALNVGEKMFRFALDMKVNNVFGLSLAYPGEKSTHLNAVEC